MIIYDPSKTWTSWPRPKVCQNCKHCIRSGSSPGGVILVMATPASCPVTPLPSPQRNRTSAMAEIPAIPAIPGAPGAPGAPCTAQ